MGRIQGVRFFIPGLPENVRDEDLELHFSKYGRPLEAVVAKEKGSEASRGFGYVTMEDGTNPDVLLNDIHVLGGKEIRVLLTKESLVGADVKKVHLNNCSHLSAEELRDAFSQFGQVWDVHTPKDVTTGERKRYAFVTFGHEDAFERAVAAGSLNVNGSRIAIRPASQTSNEAPNGPASGGGSKASGRGGCGKGDSYPGYEAGPYGKGYGPDMWGGADWGMWGPPPDMWGKAALQGPYASGKGSGSGMGKGPPEGRQPPEEGIKYFVSNLPEGIVEGELAEYFSKYGKVLDAIVVREKGKDQSRGFAYVTMKDASSRDAILSEKHEIGDKLLSIMLSKENLIGADVKKVHVDNCEHIAAETLRDVFTQFGPVLDVHTPKDHRTSERKRYAFVTFGTDEALRAAIEAGSIVIGDVEVPIKAASRNQNTIQPLAGGGRGAHSPEDDMGKGWGWDGPSMGKGFPGWGGPYGWYPSGPWAYKGYDPWSAKGGYGPWDGKGFDSWADAWGAKGWGKDAKGWGKGSSWGDPWAGYDMEALLATKGKGGSKDGGKGDRYASGKGMWGPDAGGADDRWGPAVVTEADAGWGDAYGSGGKAQGRGGKAAEGGASRRTMASVEGTRARGAVVGASKGAGFSWGGPGGGAEEEGGDQWGGGGGGASGGRPGASRWGKAAPQEAAEEDELRGPRRAAGYGAVRGAHLPNLRPSPF